MNHDIFENIINAQMKECLDVLTSKGDEYSTGEDRLHNFRVAAEMQHVTLPQAVGGMMVKHSVSIYDMLVYPFAHDIMVWNEKITDHINYLLILKATLEDNSIAYAKDKIKD